MCQTPFAQGLSVDLQLLKKCFQKFLTSQPVQIHMKKIPCVYLDIQDLKPGLTARSAVRITASIKVQQVVVWLVSISCWSGLEHDSKCLMLALAVKIHTTLIRQLIDIGNCTW